MPASTCDRKHVNVTSRQKRGKLHKLTHAADLTLHTAPLTGVFEATSLTFALILAWLPAVLNLADKSDTSTLIVLSLPSIARRKSASSACVNFALGTGRGVSVLAGVAEEFWANVAVAGEVVFIIAGTRIVCLTLFVGAFGASGRAWDASGCCQVNGSSPPRGASNRENVSIYMCCSHSLAYHSKRKSDTAQILSTPLLPNLPPILALS